MIRTNTAFLDFILTNQDRYPEVPILELNIETGHPLIRQRSTVNYVTIIKSGVAKCYLYHDNGNEFLLEFFGPGEVVGEIEMLNDDLSFSAIEAMTPMQVLQISKSDFLDLLERDKAFNAHVLKLLAAKVKYKALRHSFIQSHTLEENLLGLMAELPNLLQVISKEDLANYLGITKRSLNRTLKKLKDQGHISF